MSKSIRKSSANEKEKEPHEEVREGEIERLNEKAEELEEKIERSIDTAEEIISELKQYNKGFLTDRIHRHIQGEDYEDFCEVIDECKLKLEEDLKFLQNDVEKELKDFKKELLAHSPSLRSYLKTENGIEYFMNFDKGLKYQSRFVHWNDTVQKQHPGTVSSAERYFVDKTKHYDLILQRLEDDIMKLDEKIQSAEENLRLGEEPGKVAKSLYSSSGRLLAKNDPHNIRRIKKNLKKAKNISPLDYS
jgi:transposase-like protein